MSPRGHHRHLRCRRPRRGHPRVNLTQRHIPEELKLLANALAQGTDALIYDRDSQRGVYAVTWLLLSQDVIIILIGGVVHEPIVLSWPPPACFAPHDNTTIVRHEKYDPLPYPACVSAIHPYNIGYGNMVERPNILTRSSTYCFSSTRTAKTPTTCAQKPAASNSRAP